MLPSETMIWQPEFTDKTLSRKPGAVHTVNEALFPVVITQAILFRFLSANHGIEVFTFNGKLQVSHG
nr:hypothetical protein [Escherichia coli]